MMTMDNSKRPGDNMEQNGAPDAKRSKSDVQNPYTNGFSQENSTSKCPVCLWPLDSSNCYHSSDQQDDATTSRRLH